MDNTAPIRSIKGVGAKTEQLFQKTGVYTVGDILLRFPREYIAFPQPVEIDQASVGKKQAVIYHVSAPALVRRGRTMPVTVANGTCGGVHMEFLWFRMPYIKNTLVKGETFLLYGTVLEKGGRLSMEQPAIYTPAQYAAIAGSLQPVYGLTAGLTNHMYKKTILQVLDKDAMPYPEYLPEQILEKQQFMEYGKALAQIHFPDSMDALTEARRRLVFDEFFLFLLSIQLRKEEVQKQENIYHIKADNILPPLLEKLPYRLTDAQSRALKDILHDLQGPYIMQRLIQGDVGSGKTIVAFLSMYTVSVNGFQSALMAPTEVLAVQHYETFQRTCEMLGLKAHVILLTGSMTAKQKRHAYERMQLYSDAMIIGTHALIQERAIYEDLALVITDEQHRFGVRQREAFAKKGHCPHTMVMSATPIPRTLAIILYGDLDISVIDEVPAKRLPIKNCVVGIGYRPKAYDFIRREVEAGHQAYVICPFVEAGETMDGENAIDYSEKLKQELPEGIEIGILHGKMRPDLKNRIMEAFSANKIQVLVSTTVVEVGVDVPNATVIMIEDAQRFGLAQLHQLRGRVGRGDAQSYCIMMDTSDTAGKNKRLEILNKTNDGFKIASEDLKLRGPGDFFGIRQSGDLSFRLADIYQDSRILQTASQETAQILAADPRLQEPAHAALKKKLEAYFDSSAERMNL